MGKEIIYDLEALLKIKQGVEKMVNAMKTTYGPGGRNVVFEDHGMPVMTKDGATVAEQIELKDPFENMGAKLILQVSQLTAQKAGDGTTTVAILAAQLLSEGIRRIASGVNPIDLQKGISKAHTIAAEKLLEFSRPINDREELAKIAILAVNNDPELGNLIADAFEKSGKDRLVQVQEGKRVTSSLEFVEGLEMEGGFLSPYFVTDSSTNETVLENTLVFITNNRISYTHEIVPLLIQIVDAAKPVLIIAKDFDSEVISMLANNKRNNALKCAAVKSTLAGDSLEKLLHDISLIAGTEVFSKEKGQDLMKVPIEKLGSIDKVIIGATKTRLIAAKRELPQLEAFIKSLKAKLGNSPTSAQRKKLEERLTRLTGGIAVISIGASTETELKEKLYRVDNGIKAVKSALEEGIVPGGGITWLYLFKHLDSITDASSDVQSGMTVFKKSLTAPFIVLAENAGKEPLPMLINMLKTSPGVAYDFQKNRLVNIWDQGIIDPAKVLRITMENAVSVVSELLKTKVAIAESSEHQH